jgi:hypothetical protein
VRSRGFEPKVPLVALLYHEIVFITILISGVMQVVGERFLLIYSKKIDNIV